MAELAAPEAVRNAVDEDRYVDVSFARRFLSVSRAMVYKLMDDRALPYAKFGRARRIPLRALKEYARSRLVGA